MNQLDEIKRLLKGEFDFTAYLAGVIQQIVGEHEIGLPVPPQEYLRKTVAVVTARGELLARIEELATPLEGNNDEAALRHGLMNFFKAVTEELPNLSDDVVKRLQPVVLELENLCGQIIVDALIQKLSRPTESPNV